MKLSAIIVSIVIIALIAEVRWSVHKLDEKINTFEEKIGFLMDSTSAHNSSLVLVLETQKDILKKAYGSK